MTDKRPTSTNAPIQIVEPTTEDDEVILPLERLDSRTSVKTTSRTTSFSQGILNVPLSLRSRSPSRSRPRSPDTISLLSADDLSELRRVRSSSFPNNEDPLTAQPLYTTTQRLLKPRTLSEKTSAFWIRNKGLFLVIASQVCGTFMITGTRLLEQSGRDANGEGGMHPFQIIFARMSMTTLLSCTYMYLTKTPDFPLGAKGVRAILVARGMGGFFGLFGLYWSLQYLPLSDATVLTFLAPFIASAVCAKLLKEPFTRIEQLGGLVSLVGVVLIARPTSLFHSGSSPSTDGVTAGTEGAAPSNAADGAPPHATSAQRLAAVGMAMVGVCGASIAYTTIRWIGTRAHPLISVNYFATWATIVSATALTFVPSVPFIFPRTPQEWLLLGMVGVGGFATQFLLTAGLRYEKSSRAQNMVYSQMLFALAADRLIWGNVPGAWSLGGSALILGSAIVVAVQKESMISAGKGNEVGERDEEAALVEGYDGAVAEIGGADGRAVEMVERGRTASVQLDSGRDGVR